MLRRIALAPAVALAMLVAETVHAEEPLPAGSLPCRSPFIRFEILAGRLSASAVGQGQPRAATAAHPSGAKAETLELSGPGDRPTVRYECVCPRERLTIEIARGVDWRVIREPLADTGAARVSFTQLAGRDLALAVDGAAGPVTFAAPTLWHLLLREPETCRRHLLPILARLRSDWLFEERLTEIQAALVEQCRGGAVERARRCGQLIDLLGAPQYSVRQQADQELRELGQSTLACLARLDFSRLDAEQRQRLRSIREDLAPRSGDTLDRAALWLLDDQQVWLTLLAHQSAAYRHMAALQLARICDRPIEFDPAAAEIERAAQIERLRQRLARGL